MEIISIRAAEAAGLKHYFTGKPCKYGHVAPRYISTWKCVPCTFRRVAEWQDKNPERTAANKKKYKKLLPHERKLENSRRDHVTERVRRETKMAKIAGRPRPFVCDICEQPNSRRSDVIAFDHCHKHGHFRGWLCDRCNISLGAAKDDPDLLRKMAEYLEKTAIPDPSAHILTESDKRSFRMLRTEDKQCLS